MSKVLVAYATAAGSIGEVAEAIGNVPWEGGATIDVRPAKKVRDVGGYDAVFPAFAHRDETGYPRPSNRGTHPHRFRKGGK